MCLPVCHAPRVHDAYLHLLDSVAHCSERSIPHQFLAHHFSTNHCKKKRKLRWQRLISNFETIRAKRHISLGAFSSILLKKTLQLWPVGGLSKAHYEYHFKTRLVLGVIRLSDFLHCCRVPRLANGWKKTNKKTILGLRSLIQKLEEKGPRPSAQGTALMFLRTFFSWKHQIDHVI